jgi:hypothetical protein
MPCAVTLVLVRFSSSSARFFFMDWLCEKVKVLALERTIRSKKLIQRPKDLAHLPILRDVQRPVAAREAQRRGGA